MMASMPGMLLGTPAYMAPEQARGTPVDKRADIWAFGVVFYEMLTGRRAFDGEDVSSILAAVLQSEPRWDGVPPNLRRVLESCLEKDPRNRLRDIGDVWRLVDDARRPAAPSLRPARTGWMAAAALAVVAAIALWAPWRKAPIYVAPLPLRLDVDLGSDVSLEPLVGPTFSTLVISPDGTRLVFVGSVSRAPSRLFVRRLDDGTMRELAGTQGATNPFISPDGQWVAFWKDGKLAKVPLEGGAVVPLADLGTMAGGSWADDGDLVVGTGTGLVRIAAGGGSPTPVVNLSSGELFHTFPHVVAGRKAVLFAELAPLGYSGAGGSGRIEFSASKKASTFGPIAAKAVIATAVMMPTSSPYSIRSCPSSLRTNALNPLRVGAFRHLVIDPQEARGECCLGFRYIPEPLVRLPESPSP